MAAEFPVQALCKEVTCPICLDYFKFPMTTDCGHNFCRSCLWRYWSESRGPFPCPQCREMILEKKFMINRHLARIVQHVKDLQEQQNPKRKRGECEKHQEPFKLFCKDDEVPICVVCDRSMDHRGHDVYPVNEVSEGYKEKLKEHMKSLKNNQKQICFLKQTKVTRMQSCLIQLEQEKMKITSAFDRMQTLLEEKKCFWLTKLQDLEKTMKDEEKGILLKISAEISELNQLIGEMEEKCQQPPSELLQDIKNALSRCDERSSVRCDVDLSPQWEERLRIYSQKNSDLRKVVESHKESLQHALDKVNLEPSWDAVSVTLDQSRAHPEMLVSKDLKTGRCSENNQQLTELPLRIFWDQGVLGCEGFNSGRHWWEVEVNMEGRGLENNLFKNPHWALGIVKDSVKKEPIKLNFNEGMWAVGGKITSDLSSPSEIYAFTSTSPTCLVLKQKPKKIRVTLDYEEGWVDFFDADTDEFIFTFYSGSFSGETVRPFFCTLACNF